MHTFDGASCQKYEKLKKMRPLSGKRVGSMQCKVIGIRLRKFSTKICLRPLQASHRRLLSLQLPHFLDLPDKHKHKSYSEGLSTTLHPLAFVHQLQTSSRCAAASSLRGAQRRSNLLFATANLQSKLNR